MCSLKGGPGRINDERAQAEKDQERLLPPDVRPHRLAKGASRQFGGGVRHRLFIMTEGASSSKCRFPHPEPMTAGAKAGT